MPSRNQKKSIDCENGKVKYTELVPEIAQEPNYAAALAALKN